MNQIDELEIQNLTDSFHIFYLSLAEAVLSARGELEGEMLLRAAVRSFGQKIGTAERRAHLEAGLKTNLETFYRRPVWRVYDPRLFVETQRLNEQVALFNVIRCPLAAAARTYCGQTAAKIFCEEYTPACLEAYTERIAQCNLSEVLTESENNHCRIANYFRPANLPEEDANPFSSFDEESCGMSETDDTRDAVFAVSVLQASAKRLAAAFSEAGADDSEVSAGSRLAAERLADFLCRRSVSMEQKLDRGFCERNCAVVFEEAGTYLREKLELQEVIL